MVTGERKIYAKQDQVLAPTTRLARSSRYLGYKDFTKIGCSQELLRKSGGVTILSQPDNVEIRYSQITSYPRLLPMRK